LYFCKHLQFEWWIAQVVGSDEWLEMDQTAGAGDDKMNFRSVPAGAFLSSRWAVVFTSALIRDVETGFYTNPRFESGSRADALRITSLAMHDGGDCAHPHYCAPFVLIGNRRWNRTIS